MQAILIKCAMMEHKCSRRPSFPLYIPLPSNHQPNRPGGFFIPIYKEWLRWEPNKAIWHEGNKSHENKLIPTTSVYTSQYLQLHPSAIPILYALFQSLYRSQRDKRELRHNNDCKRIPSGVSSRALEKGRKMAAGKRWDRRAEQELKSANYS